MKRMTKKIGKHYTFHDCDIICDKCFGGCKVSQRVMDKYGELEDLLEEVGLERLRELVEADREGRCVVMEDLTIFDLQQMLIVLDATHDSDGAETYTAGYRNGHRNGRIEILRHVLEIPEGDSSDTEAALKAREQDD